MTPLEYIVDHREDCVSYAEACLPTDLVAEAEDVVQDLTLYYISKFGGEPVDNPQAYVNKAIANTCNSLRRQERRRAELRKQNDTRIKDTFNYLSVHPEASEELEAEELETEIFNGMSDMERDIYTAIVIQGVSYKDVAESMEMTEAAVRQHISRIKKRFNNGRS